MFFIVKFRSKVIIFIVISISCYDGGDGEIFERGDGDARLRITGILLNGFILLFGGRIFVCFSIWSRKLSKFCCFIGKL